ncbi:MAG TPA: PLD nuclease N-terminal domain-containing protein [Actinomycetota bacterium]
MPYGVAAVITLFVWIWALADAISTDEMLVRNLPKIVWLLIIIFVPLVGSLMWLILGRPSGVSMRPGGTATVTEHRPRHLPAPPRALPAAAVGPEDSPEFLNKLAEQQRRLRDWEEDLKRREEELRRREQGDETGV